MPYYILQMALKIQDLFGRIGPSRLNAIVGDYNR